MNYRFFLALFLILIFPPAAFSQTNMRGWYADGQTWLVWEDTQPQPFTYDIYVSDEAIADVESAQLSGRVFPDDWQATRLKLAQDDATWTIPDGQGGAYMLAANEALFVYTPHATGDKYFAVVKNGASDIGPQNSIGPITQALDPVQCHTQFSGVSELDQDYTTYAHWVDGRADYENGREDYPVMANQYAGGVGHVFAVFEPDAGRTDGLMPATVTLHGGGQSAYYRFGMGSNDNMGIKTTYDDGFIVSLDDCLFMMKTFLSMPGVWPEPTRWFGYWSEYNRYEMPETQPPDDAIIVDYTQRRLAFIIDWVLDNLPIDPARLSAMGLSGGGSGVMFTVKSNPDKFSAATTFVMPFEGTTFTNALYMQGEIDQNLQTTIGEGIGLREWYWPLTLLHDDDVMPFMRIVVGKKDTFMDWALQVQAFGEIENEKWGAHVFWDQRDHIWNWENTHWFGSPRLDPEALSKFRNDQSFPAFTNDDQDPGLEGRQPDIGVESAEDGEPWGAWGGYYAWDTESILDTETEWAATIYLLGESTFANDVPDFNQSTADVTIRRAQNFKPAPDTLCTWSLTRLSDNQIVQDGDTLVGPDGLITISDLTIAKQASRLRVALESAEDDDDAHDDDSLDDDASDPDDDDNDIEESDSGSDDDDSGCGC